jgi:HEAT repeat protein
MRRPRFTYAAIAIAMAIAGTGVAVAVQPPDEVIELLSETATAPSKSRIVIVMGPTAVPDLIKIAEDSSVDSDPGWRIRAFAALRHFGQEPESETVRLALKEAVDLYRAETTGTKLLYLRAAMLSMAEVGMELAVADLLGLLDHPSRDIRAACAQALGITGSDLAIVPLRDRALIEQEPQVNLAIGEALFALESD